MPNIDIQVTNRKLLWQFRLSNRLNKIRGSGQAIKTKDHKVMALDQLT